MKRIVCAALRNYRGEIICGPRHYDAIMRNQMPVFFRKQLWASAEQGFVDQFDNFLTRIEAWVVALDALQIRKEIPGTQGVLYSEHLY